MNTKKKLLLLFFGLLLTFLLPNFGWAAFTFNSLDTQGKLLNFGNGNAPSQPFEGTHKQKGAKYRYVNVYKDTATNTTVDAIVTIDDIVNATLQDFDNPSPNPTAKTNSRINGNGDYVTSFGEVVPEGAIFSPWIKRTTATQSAYADFTITFVLSGTNTPIALKNVYNNSLDMESVEYNAYGGFSSYTLANDNKTNLVARVLATADIAEGTVLRFSSVDCYGDSGLYIKDQSRVQAKFNIITSLKLRLGQFADQKVPDGNGGYVKITKASGSKKVGDLCTNYYPSNNSVRAYGAIFIKDNFDDMTKPPIEYTAPTVNTLITTNTKPTLTGKIGGEVSTASPDGSALVSGDTFTVKVAGSTYTAGDGKLNTNGVNWTLNIPTDLTRGTTYEVIATRNGVLIDQTNNELVISPICTKPQMLNAAGTACVTPAVNDITLCHSGNGVNYAKVSIPSSGFNGHETHEYDVLPDGSGRCPDAPKDKACTAVGQPFPPGARTDGKKVTICHFPPGNPNNVQIIPISVNALAVHIGHHYDTIWEVGKSCPRTIDDCDNPNDTTLEKPTVDFLTTTESMPTLTGKIGNLPATSSTVFSVLVDGKTYTYSTNPGGQVQSNGITITGKDWSLQTTKSIDPGNYEVVATRIEGTGSSKVTLVDEQAKELTILPACKETEAVINGICVPLPTVVITQIDGKSYDGTNRVKTSNTKPVIKGIVGKDPLGATEDFVVIVNNVSYSKKAGKVSVPDNMNWTLTMPVDLPIGIYDIVADRDNGLGDTTHEEMEITPQMPTVDEPIPLKTDSTTPTIKGTVGTIDLAPTDTFSVTVKAGSKDAAAGFEQQVYTYKTHTALTVSGKKWTLVIPTDKALEAGTYEIEAVRSAVKDESSDELIVNMQCKATETLFNGTCKSNSEFPTVDFQETADTMPTLTGTVGASPLTDAEAFTVEIAGTGQIYSKLSGAVHVDGAGVWTVDVTTPLAIKTYDIIATRADSLKDKTSNELTVITCADPKKIKNGKCVTESKIPTVNKLVTDINATKIEVTGTVGDVVLSSGESFTVKIHNEQHSDVACTLPRPTTTEWTCTLSSKPFVAGIFDVDAKRGTELDKTNQELEITGGKCCIGGKTQNCPTEISPPDRRAACESAGGTLPTKSQVLPSRPEAKTPEFVRNSNGDCEDGGKLSYNTAITNATIKRARIANAITEKGTFSGSLAGKRLIIGNLTAGSYSTLGCESEDYCEGRTINNATLTDAMIDIDPDYIDSTGAVIDENNQGILVINGTTKPTYKNRNDEDKNAVITNGIIVAGTANNAPVRGLVTNGIFVGDIDNLANNPNLVKTKGREADKVTLTNVTISNAAITTDKNGKTVVGCVQSVHSTCSIATISEWKNDSAISGNDAFVYGTVVNAVLKNATLGESNHCFSSGTVGNKGQLNWKEVVK